MTFVDAVLLESELPMTETSLVVLALAIALAVGWLYFLYR